MPCNIISNQRQYFGFPIFHITVFGDVRKTSLGSHKTSLIELAMQQHHFTKQQVIFQNRIWAQHESLFRISGNLSD